LRIVEKTHFFIHHFIFALAISNISGVTFAVVADYKTCRERRRAKERKGGREGERERELSQTKNKMRVKSMPVKDNFVTAVVSRLAQPAISVLSSLFQREKHTEIKQPIKFRFDSFRHFLPIFTCG